MLFHIYMHHPRRQGLLGPVPAKVTHSTVETDKGVEDLLHVLQAPLGGEIRVVADSAATVIKARIINEVS